MRTPYIIITTSFRLKMARNEGNCTIFAGKSVIKRVVKPRSNSEPVLRDYYGPRVMEGIIVWGAMCKQHVARVCKQQCTLSSVRSPLPPTGLPV